SGHGLSADSTGHCGPATTTPRTPESPPEPGPSLAFAHAEASIATIASRATTMKILRTALRRPECASGSRASDVDVRPGLQRGDVRQVAEALGVVEPVAHHEVGGDLEPAVLD